MMSETPMFDPTKPHTTRDGREVTGLRRCDYAWSYPYSGTVDGAAQCWHLNGRFRYWDDDAGHPLDLVNVPEPLSSPIVPQAEFDAAWVVFEIDLEVDRRPGLMRCLEAAARVRDGDRSVTGLEPPGCPLPGACACPGGEAEMAKRLAIALAAARVCPAPDVHRAADRDDDAARIAEIDKAVRFMPHQRMWDKELVFILDCFAAKKAECEALRRALGKIRDAAPPTTSATWPCDMDAVPSEEALLTAAGWLDGSVSASTKQDVFGEVATWLRKLAGEGRPDPVAAEREACAKLCDKAAAREDSLRKAASLADEPRHLWSRQSHQEDATAIRARARRPSDAGSAGGEA